MKKTARITLFLIALFSQGALHSEEPSDGKTKDLNKKVSELQSEVATLKSEIKELRAELKDLKAKSGPKADSKRDTASEAAFDSTFQPGSVWRGVLQVHFVGDPPIRSHQVTMTVQERSGEKFKALYEVEAPRSTPPRSVRVIAGTIKNGVIQWLAKDVKVFEGIEGPDQKGTLTAEKLVLHAAGVSKGTGKRFTSVTKLYPDVNETISPK